MVKLTYTLKYHGGRRYRSCVRMSGG
jgi:hypothetical protein